MKELLNSAIAMPARPSAIWETAEGFGPRRLEVNVIFTDPHATAAALKTAGSLARDLGACIRVRATITVPYTQPLDKPAVSVSFAERLVSDLVYRMELDTFEPRVHLYLCRSQIETLLRVLSPHSLVLIGGWKHWWPTAERRIVRALRSKGHRVIFVRLKRKAGSNSL